jgi:putative FmdB family regulatory protein
MPTYEYRCQKCEKDFEIVESVTDHDPAKARCPECGSEDVERRWSQVYAVTSKKS